MNLCIVIIFYKQQNNKKDDDTVKLCHETKDGMTLIHKGCKPEKDKFGIIGLQVAGSMLYLNILLRNRANIGIYYHLKESKVPVQQSYSAVVAKFILSILRNILYINTSLIPCAPLTKLYRKFNVPTYSHGRISANNLRTVYPTMIIEVGHTQSFPGLHQKIFEPHVDHTIVLIVVLCLCTSLTPLIPVRVISFGTASPHQNTVTYITNINNGMGVPPDNFIGVGCIDSSNGDHNYPLCNVAGIATYQTSIPAAELFDGDTHGIPAGFDNGFYLEL
nr:7522_t:CDS:2 [Entrophospora candida]